MSEYKRLAAIIKGGESVRLKGQVIKTLPELAEALNPAPEEVDPEEVGESARLKGKLRASEARVKELESEAEDLKERIEVAYEKYEASEARVKELEARASVKATPAPSDTHPRLPSDEGAEPLKPTVGPSDTRPAEGAAKTDPKKAGDK